MFAGFKTPPLMPALKPEEMAQAVVDGILKDRKIVAKPITVFTLPILNALLPPGAVDAVIKILGYDKSAYHCKGFYKP